MRQVFHSSAIALIASLASICAAKGAVLSPAAEKAVESQSAAFVENKGQWDAQALFLSRTNGLNLWVTEQGMVFDFHRSVFTSASSGEKHADRAGYTNGQVVKMSFVYSQATAVEGKTQVPGAYNFFIGSDQRKWAANVPAYSHAIAEQPYKGISVDYSIDHGLPRYDVIVAPGADPSQVGLKLGGADGAQILSNGNLLLKTSLGNIEERGLTAYQNTPNGPTQIPCSLVLDGDTVRFDIGSYDSSKALVIDPLVYSSYLGGTNGSDSPVAVMTDSAANLYVAGTASSTNFPTTTGAYQKTQKGIFTPSAFVTKMNASESELIYSTLVGGTQVTQAYAAAIDKNLDVYITGRTNCNDYPTTKDAFQTVDEEENDQGYAGFVTKLNSLGSALVYSTYLAGTGNSGYGDNPYGIAVDTSENAYIVGATFSTDFPVTSTAYQKTDPEIVSGNFTGFLTKLNPTGSAPVYSTFLGGKGNGLLKGDSALDVVVDSADDAYVAGFTCSTDFPVTASAFQKTNKGSALAAASGFITKFNSAGSALAFSTYLGGSGGDQINAVALDATNDVVVAGNTDSLDFPVTSGAYMVWDPESYNPSPTLPATTFVAKLASTGSALDYATYLGGSGGDDSATGLKLDSLGDAIVVGNTESSDFPTTAGAFQSTLLDAQGAYISKFNPTGTALLYSTFLGGGGEVGGTSESCDGVTLNGSNVVVVGYTDSSSFPVTADAYNSLGASGFVSTFSLPASALAISSFEISPRTLSGGELPGTGVISLNNSTTSALTFTLKVSGPAAAPSEVVVPQGGTTASFRVTTVGVNVTTTVSITAISGTLTATAKLTVTAPTVDGFDLNQSFVIGGHPINGLVFLSAQAGSPATDVTLSSNSAAAVVASPLVIPFGMSTGRTTIQTKAVSADTTVTLTGTLGTSSIHATLKVFAARVAALTVPASCVGGATVSGKITLSSPAGPTGDVVTLTSGSVDAVVSKTVTVPAGVTTVSFSIATKKVTANVGAVISATFESEKKSSTLLVEK